MRPRQLSIQPLPRAAWQRIEHEVFARLDRHERSGEFPAVRQRERWRPAHQLLAGVALVGCGSLLWLALERASGVDAPAAPAAPATSAGAGKREGQAAGRVATTAAIDVPVGDSVVTIGEQSVVQVQGDDERGWLLELRRGEVACRVAPRAGRAPFVVRAGDTTVTVLGTRFSVSRAGEGAHVSVQEGVVRVERAGKVVQLLAGDRWPPQAEEPPGPESREAVRSRAEAEDEAGRGAASRGQAARVAAERPLRSARGARKARAASPKGSQQVYERAVRLEASDPDAALEMYRRVGARGVWAANALYGRARLRLERGDARGARRDLELYLRRHPQGSNVEDVRALLERPR